MAIVTGLQFGKYETVAQDDYTTQYFIDYKSERLKVLNYQGNVEKVIKNSLELCGKYGLGKIYATAREEDHQIYLDHGFVDEAIIDGYFKGDTGYNVSFFYDLARKASLKINEEDEILENAKKHAKEYTPLEKSEFHIRTASIKDAEALAQLYDRVFATYPTPMHKAEYIKNVMSNNKGFFKIAEDSGRIVSAASAELNHEYLNAEITDCATASEYRGKGLLSELVSELENSLRRRSFGVLFSIARAISPGINIVFSKHGYTFAGRQISHSYIMGSFEDMNIWVKQISRYLH
ncbi:MAG: putative beta-lysine N-acetyltransferase [Firmicutes bacterium]|nr:putative beta-lysine N-acetyltransferase [Bacillota bacterium]